MKKLFGLALLALAFFVPVSAEAAARFAVCITTCTWNNDGIATGIMWATTSGGTVGAAAPVAADQVTFDAATCVGGTTCTITTFAGTISVTSINFSACTASTAGCILDASVNNTNFTIGGSGFSNSGSGLRTINMGNGTWDLTQSSGNVWLQGGATNLTLNKNGSTLQFSGTSTTAIKSITFGTFSYNIVTFGSTLGGYSISGAPTIATWNITAPTAVTFASGMTATITNALAITGSSGNAVGLISSTTGTAYTLALGAASTCTWCAIRDMTNTTSSFTLTNSFDLGHNIFTGGGSISPPSGGSGGGRGIIGG